MSLSKTLDQSEKRSMSSSNVFLFLEDVAKSMNKTDFFCFLSRVFFFFSLRCSTKNWIEFTIFVFRPSKQMTSGSERRPSDSNVRRLKDQLVLDRHDWPSQRDSYMICGKLGEGATGKTNKRMNKEIFKTDSNAVRRNCSLGNVYKLCNKKTCCN